MLNARRRLALIVLAVATGCGDSGSVVELSRETRISLAAFDFGMLTTSDSTANLTIFYDVTIVIQGDASIQPQCGGSARELPFKWPFSILGTPDLPFADTMNVPRLDTAAVYVQRCLTLIQDIPGGGISDDRDVSVPARVN